ncbi:MAG: hypothetical protein ABEJ03_03050 [Candidatus Nanohaloarchaea archaeon]
MPESEKAVPVSEGSFRNLCSFYATGAEIKEAVRYAEDEPGEAYDDLDDEVEYEVVPVMDDETRKRHGNLADSAIAVGSALGSVYTAQFANMDSAVGAAAFGATLIYGLTAYHFAKEAMSDDDSTKIDPEKSASARAREGAKDAAANYAAAAAIGTLSLAQPDPAINASITAMSLTALWRSLDDMGNTLEWNEVNDRLE